MGRKAQWPPHIHVKGGQSYIKITWNGERLHIGLGPEGSAEARQEYNRVLAEIEAGRCPVRSQKRLTVAELARGYLLHAREHQEYRSLARTQKALKTTGRLYGHTFADEFRARDARVVREVLVREGLARRYVNRLMVCLRQCWRWGIEEYDLPATALESLRAMAPLRKRQTAARELEPVRAVEEEIVLATIPHMPPIVADMVRVQLYTGMRPGEVCALAPGDLDIP